MSSFTYLFEREHLIFHKDKTTIFLSFLSSTTKQQLYMTYWIGKGEEDMTSFTSENGNLLGVNILPFMTRRQLSSCTFLSLTTEQ
jgi:hypothetical protein